MKLKVFSQKFVGMVGFPAISPNVWCLAKAGINSTNVQIKNK